MPFTQAIPHLGIYLDKYFLQLFLKSFIMDAFVTFKEIEVLRLKTKPND